MLKMVILYAQPDDVEAFEAAYAKHIELVKKVPGVSQTRVTRFRHTFRGEEYYLMGEVFFPDEETMQAAMQTAEMGAVSKDAEQFANLKVIVAGAE